MVYVNMQDYKIVR